MLKDKFFSTIDMNALMSLCPILDKNILFDKKATMYFFKNKKFSKIHLHFISFHSIYFHSFMIILFYSIPFHSFMNFQTKTYGLFGWKDVKFGRQKMGEGQKSGRIEKIQFFIICVWLKNFQNSFTFHSIHFHSFMIILFHSISLLYELPNEDLGSSWLKGWKIWKIEIWKGIEKWEDKKD